MKTGSTLKLLLACATCAGSATSALAAPVPVELVEAHGTHRLLRGGEPYYIRGAGGGGDLELLARIGANSVRTWGEPVDELLDRAHALGLSVCVGLWIEHERHGFDYDDAEAVERQLQRHRETIDRYKDHPAVLVWGIGNEVELEAGNPRVWDLVEAVAAYAKEVDPHHPTMTVIAHAPAGVIAHIRERSPSIDILGCNSYGGIGILAREVREAGWHGPYIVGEWGNNGTWEAARTGWGAEIEPTSTEKAAQRAARYGRLADDRENCLGAYAFHWGSKQEATPTWFGMFTEDGRQTESVGLLQYVWTGAFPQHLAPRVANLRLNGKEPESSLRMRRGRTVRAGFDLTRGDQSALEVHWELLPESDDKRIGGDAEERPAPVDLDAGKTSLTGMRFRAPREPGAYRLFLYVKGEGGTVATANFPFLVE